MADEITIFTQLRNDQSLIRFEPPAYTADQAAVGGGAPGMVTVGTSEEDISFGDVVPGWVAMKNLDDTNFVTFGPKSAGAMVALGKLLAGETAIFRLASGVTLRMIADTAACKLLIVGLNA
jgi:hypothetical protein